MKNLKLGHLTPKQQNLCSPIKTLPQTVAFTQQEQPVLRPRTRLHLGNILYKKRLPRLSGCLRKYSLVISMLLMISQQSRP